MKTWNDITVGQWQAIDNILENETNELLRWLDILPIIEDITKTQLRAMSQKAFGNMVGPWKELLEKMPEAVMTTVWKHEGKTFKATTNLDEMTFGQFIDASSIGKRVRPTQDLHRFLAIWYSAGKYDPTAFEENASYFQRHMPMSVAYPISNHFIAVWTASLPAIQTYLKAAADQVGSLSGGTGTQRSTGWQRVIGWFGTPLRARA